MSPTATLPLISDSIIATTDSSVAEKRSNPVSPTHKTMQAYARPLQKLVSVAKEGEVDSLQPHVNALQARAIRLTGIAESAAGTLRNNPQLKK